MSASGQMGTGYQSPGASWGNQGQGQKFQSQFNNSNNVYDQSAAGLGGAMNTAFQGLNYSPMQVQGGGYNPAMMNGGGQMGYNGAQINAPSPYDAERVNAPTDYSAGQLLNTDLTNYMNPYTNQVIDQSMGDIDRARQMQGNNVDAQATAAGGFGGSRQALMQSENNRNHLDQQARTSAGLRNQGYQNAQGAAMSDIQGRNQAGMFNNQMDMQGQLANQQAGNQASQFNNAQQLQAGMANQSSQNQGMASQMQARLQEAMSNQQATNQAGQFNAGMDMQGQMANQNAWSNANSQRQNSANSLSNMSNLGFGMGNQSNQGLFQNGGMQQQSQQQLIDAAKGQFGNFSNMPQQQQQMLQQLMGSMPGGGGTQTQSKQNGVMDYATMAMMAMSMFSDYRLKDQVVHIGTHESGHNLYQWKWNDLAKSLGKPLGPETGVLAQEVRQSSPQAVTESPEGFLMVNYGAL